MPGAREARVPKVLKHYRLVREVGRGGMGVVFEGRDRRDNSRIAVKVLHPHLSASDPGYGDRFEREAHVAALLRSPYTVHLLDYGVVEGWYFLVMEFVEGQTLADLLEKQRLDPASSLRIATDVARALEEAEAREVVHRDIKPENVLIDPNGSVKVTDFGIARQTADSLLTTPGGFIGTATYAAPEQAAGLADRRSDIYALGATLFTMLAGHPPFGGSTMMEMLRAHREDSVPMGALSGLPERVVNVVRRCLEKDPRDRYQSPSELSGALQRARQALQTAVTWPPAAASPPVFRAGPVYSEPPETAVAAIPPGSTNASGTDDGVSSQQAPLSQVGTPGEATAVGAGPAPTRVSQPTSGNQLVLALRPSKSSIRGSTTYDLLIHNESTGWANPRLVTTDPTGAVIIDAPATTTVAPGATGIVRVNVAPRHRRWRGGREKRTFLVAADADGTGGPPATVSGEFEDVPFGRVAIGGGVAGVVLAATLAVGVALAASNGSGNSPAQPATTPDATVTPVPLSPTQGIGTSATTVASASAAPPPTEVPSPPASPTPAPAEQAAPPPTTLPRATPVPPTSTPVPPTPTPVPLTPTPTSSVPARAIAVGNWDYAFTVVSNDCGFGLALGQPYYATYTIDNPGSSDGYAVDGDGVDVYQVTPSQDYYLGNFLFTFPNFQVRYGLAAPYEGTAILTNKYTGTNSGIASLVEQYNVNGRICTIYASE